MPTAKVSSNRVAKPIQGPSYTSTANAAPVPTQPAPAWTSPAASGQGSAPSNLSGDALKKYNALMQIANSGTPSAPAAKRLADQIVANPKVINDPNFDSQLQGAIVSYSFGVAGNKIPQPAQDIVQSQITQPLVQKEQAAQTQATQDSIVQQVLDNANAQKTDNKQFSDQYVVPALNAQRNANGAAMFGDQQRATDIGAASSKLQGTLSGLSQQQRAAASGYNSMGSQMYGSYAAGQNALNTQDQGTLSKYMGETDPLMTQLQAHGSNPQDIANQQAALSAATGIANGSLDYQAAQAQLTQAALAQAKLSQYQSNPADWQRQLDSYYKLQGVGNGTLDYRSQAAQAYADPGDVANQRKALTDIQNDVAHGNKDQLDALNLIKSRTGNTATAEEAFLAENARRKFENDDRSSRDAVMHDLAMRGLRSGSAEIANQLGQRENSSQDRTLAELGLQANAQQRARAYTGMQADQSNAMRNSQQNALGMQGNLSTSMRNASFDEAYKRGVGADTASANNQSTRFGGIAGAANQSNAMRNANDQVGMFNTGQANTLSMFNTGQANQVNMFNAGEANQTSQFNAGQTNNARANNQATRLGGTQLQASQSNAIRNSNDAMSMFQDNFASQEASRVGNLAGQRAQTGLSTTSQIGTRNDTTYTNGANMLQTNYGRDQNSIALDIGNAGVGYGADTDVANAKNDVYTNAANRAMSYTGSASGVASGRAGTAQSDNQALVNALILGNGLASKKLAASTYGGY
jgi:hypothetical protein